MNHPYRSIRVSFLVLFTISLLTALPVCGEQAKKSYSKALIGRKHLRAPQEGGGPPGEPAASLLAGLDGKLLELYEDVALVEINVRDKDELKSRGHQQSVLLEVQDDFDKVFLNGKTVDVREANGGLPGEHPDPPYADDESGAWLIQFVGPIKIEWLEAVRTAGIVPVQYVPSHTYVVGARESAIRAIENLPYVQWTSQLHRYFKPSIAVNAASGSSIVAMDAETVELWIELAKTTETPDAVARLQSLSDGAFESEDWSDAEVRVQGVFETTDIDTILAEPLVFGLAERPTVDLSDERSVLAVTNIVSSVGASSADTGKYKKWLSDLCPSCTNLHADGFYIGIADTGLDGGDRAASGTLAGEPPSSDFHRTELPKNRVAWGRSFAPIAFEGSDTWSSCVTSTSCPDTTGSKHDIIGHGTMVAGIAAGDPLATGGKDSGGFFLGLGVAPSAGLFITKTNPRRITDRTRPVQQITRDALAVWSVHSYWQNYSMNQYVTGSPTNCATFYDGGYTLLSRDFDQAVRDGDDGAAGNQQITLTVSSGNINQQLKSRTRCLGTQPILTLPPATAKNVIAVGGGENAQPDEWLCRAGTRSDEYANLAMDAKHGTTFAGWYKPDLIAVSSNIASSITSDATHPAPFCSGVSGEPTLPPEYRASSGTSFSAPVGAAAAALASRRFSSNPAGATPALVKAMLIAGAKSIRNGIDRAWLRRWGRSDPWLIGDQAIPTTPNGHYYEVESVGTAGFGSATTEPAWPTNGGTATDGFGTTSIVWRDKGLESQGLAIPHFPNSQQGFGRIALDDVLSDYPMRVFVNETQTLSVGGSWSGEYVVHDLSLPVRIALVWTDQPAMWTTGATSPTPPLVNDLDLSVRVNQSGNCVGRYVGNDINSVDESIYSQPCTGGFRDSRNNVEIARFFASSSRGDTTFTVRVDFPAGTSTQNFALVIWNAYDFSTVTPPPPTPTLDAFGLSGSQVALSWPASAGAASYEIQRSLGVRDPYVAIATVNAPATSYTDSGRTTGTTYLYRIRARNATGVSDWSIDPGTTIAFTDPSLVAGETTVKAVHISQLREAVASIRVLAELPVVTWSDDPLVVGGSLIRAVHITELRTALNEARTVLDLAAISFTDGTVSPGLIVVRAVHIQQLRGGL